jgi:hypothetical protein
MTHEKKISRYTQQLAGSALLLLAAFVGADERVLILEDGSQIRGELMSYGQGAYTVRTASLGIITLSDRQVERVVSVNGAISTVPTPTVATALARKPTSTVNNASIEALQSAIMSSPSLMSSMTALQSDPQMQALLSDPDVQRAVQNLDFDALSRNAKIQALMQNPQVQALTLDLGVDQQPYLAGAYP